MVSSTIKIITIVLVVAYLTVCAIVGIKKNKTNTSVREYFISNKNVGLFFLFFTCFASFCGSGNFIGFAGRTAMYGAAAYWNFLGDILLGYIAQLEQMIERAVHTSIRNQSHKMDPYSMFLCIGKRIDDLRFIQDRIVAARPVDLHQILIYHTTRTDVEVTHL